MIGVGGLGSPAALYLAAAGVGTIGLVDDDVVSISNLQRQVLYDTESAGHKKVDEAQKRLKALNPTIQIKTYGQTLNRENARALFAAYDLVLDGTDNFKTRYLISQACLATGKPHVYAGIFRFEGQVAIFKPGKGACYRCLFPQTPAPSEIPNCSEAGVLGALPGIIGSVQALEALKYILQFKAARTSQLFVFDALSLESRTLNISRRADCLHCAPNAPLFDDVSATAEDPIEILQRQKQIDTAPSFDSATIWIDVRSEEEFAQSHRPGARNIPLTRLADELANLDRSQTYVIYCASGQRSLQAQSLLLRQGFSDVWNLRRGLVL